MHPGCEWAFNTRPTPTPTMQPNNTLTSTPNSSDTLFMIRSRSTSDRNFAKTIAKRLEKIISEIIHYDQNAFIKVRTIFDAVRTIDDVMEFAKIQKIDALLTAIDFEKAFDSVNWTFLKKTLTNFNFGESLIAWIRTFYKNISSCVINNGFTSPYFQIS